MIKKFTSIDAENIEWIMHVRDIADFIDFCKINDRAILGCESISDPSDLNSHTNDLIFTTRTAKFGSAWGVFLKSTADDLKKFVSVFAKKNFYIIFTTVDRNGYKKMLNLNK